jgi:hypothetical protein
MKRATENGIIYANLNKLEIIAIFESKKSVIYTPYHILMI